MKWWQWLLSLLPAGAGILISLLASNEIINNSILYLRGSVAALASWVGVTTSVIAIMLILLWGNKTKRHKLAILEVQKGSKEERRRFLQRLDHELKNPLTAIRAGLTNLSQQPLEEYATNELVAVQTQVLRISRLVADLRKLLALEITPLETTTVNMAELLSDVVTALETQANTEGRRLTLITPNAPWPLPEINGDPDLLLLAIHNLLDNAIKFTSTGDTIEIRASDDESGISIEVADTGPGIPESEIDQVWEELYRSEQARGVSGSGLGLSLVRAIIEKHGGNVTLRSKPDQGTVFSVRLPTG